MNIGETICESGLLRLVTAGSYVWLYHGSSPLLAVPIVPAFRTPNPIRAAERALTRLRPRPPEYVFTPAVDVQGRAIGSYHAGDDKITMNAPVEAAEPLVASTIVHEIIHATGARSRCDREYISGAEAFALNHPDFPDWAYTQPSSDFTAAPLAERIEETVASLGAALIAPHLGIDPVGGAFYVRWFERAASLPFDALNQAVTDAQRAVDFVLG